MTRFLTQDSPIPPYMAFPRFLLDKDGLNETAKILYTILLDRARLSQKNDGWADEQGHVFIFFPIRNLAETMHKSEMSIKTALSALEKEDLIVRKRVSKQDLYQISPRSTGSDGQKFFRKTDGKLSYRWKANSLCDRQKTVQ